MVQISVESVSDAAWNTRKVATEFGALVLFVNPVLELPPVATLMAISPGTKPSAKYTVLDSRRPCVRVQGRRDVRLGA